MLLNTSKLDIINSFSGNIWPYFGCMHKVCMRTQKHFSLRAFRLNLFLWMWTSQNKIPIFIRNMTWYEGTTFTSHSTKFVAAWTRNCISRKKEIKVIITIKFFHVHRGSIDQNLSPSMTKEAYDWLFFFVNSHHASTAISQQKRKEMLPQNSTHTRTIAFSFILGGYLKTKPISSVSCMTVRAGIR